LYILKIFSYHPEMTALRGEESNQPCPYLVLQYLIIL